MDEHPTLYRVSVFLESTSPEEVEALVESFESAICDVDHSNSSARCPLRWFIVTSDLSVEEAAEWEELLNE